MSALAETASPCLLLVSRETLSGPVEIAAAVAVGQAEPVRYPHVSRETISGNVHQALFHVRSKQPEVESIPSKISVEAEFMSSGNHCHTSDSIVSLVGRTYVVGFPTGSEAR